LGVFAAGALAQTRPARVGFLSAASEEANAPLIKAFHQGMAELGWMEGRDYAFTARYGGGVHEAMARAASELVASRPDILLAAGDAAIRPLADRTRKIPIVFAAASNPVGSGFADSLQRPGGNLTGITTLSFELVAKRLQLLKDTFPSVSNVALLYDPSDSASVMQLEQHEEAAQRLKLRLSPVEFRQGMQLDAVLARAMALRPDAFALAPGPFLAGRRRELAEQLLRTRLPAIAEDSRLVEGGVLISYGPSRVDNYRRAATYATRILKGAKPAELAIEQPSRLELTVNMRTAKAMGISFPQTLLMRADRVIE
jgi:putative ABC transport system substrate-binding protein